MNGVTARHCMSLSCDGGWILFGQSPAATRSLSVVFSMLGIVVSVRTLSGFCTARGFDFAAAIIALAGLDIDIANSPARKPSQCSPS